MESLRWVRAGFRSAVPDEGHSYAIRCLARAPRNRRLLVAAYAHAWRQRCRDWAAIPDYEEGDKIKLAKPVTLTDGSTCQIVTATHYRRGRQKRRCYRIEETGGLVRFSKASLAGSELLSSAKGEASPVLAEFLAGQGD